MKNSILKNFLNGASVVVISLLATISPSSAEAPPKGKLSFGAKSPVSPKGKLFFGAKSPVSPKGKLSFGAKSPVSPKGKLSFGTKSPMPPKGKLSFGAKSLTSAPKRVPVSKQSSLANLLLSGKQKAVKSAVASRSLTPAPKRAPISKQPSLTDLLLSEKNKAVLNQQEVARQQVVEQRRQQEVARQQVVEQRRQQEVARQQVIEQRHQQEVARQQVLERQRQQEVARQQEELRRQEAWNRLTPTERLVRTPFVKTMTPLAPAELRWVLVGRESHLLRVIQDSLPQQNARLRDLIDGLVSVTSVRQTLAGRNQAGEKLDNFGPPALLQAFRGSIDEIEEVTEGLVDFGANLPLQLVGVRHQLVRDVPIVREALTAGNALDLFRGVARLRGTDVTVLLNGIQNALEEMNSETLEILMTPQILTPLRTTFANNARVLGSLNALADVHRITQVLNIRDIAAREQALTARPMQDALQNLHIEPHNGRVIQRNFEEVYSPTVDLGYQGPGRTLQYGNTGQGLNLPKAPAFHPYHPSNNLQPGWGAPAISVNVKLPAYTPTFVPPALDGHLRRLGIQPQNIDTYLISQDMPWNLAQHDGNDSLLLRPQGWAIDAPFSVDRAYNEARLVSAGVFARRPGGPLIRGQNEGDLLAPQAISSHNTATPQGVVTDPHIISSPSNFPLHQLNMADSQVLFSLTVHQNRAAVVKHLLLNAQDQTILEEALNRPAVNTYEDALRELRAEPTRRRLSPSGQGILDEFDIPVR